MFNISFNWLKSKTNGKTYNIYMNKISQIRGYGDILTLQPFYSILEYIIEVWSDDRLCRLLY